jgi:hypothetical protein
MLCRAANVDARHQSISILIQAINNQPTPFGSTLAKLYTTKQSVSQ